MTITDIDFSTLEDLDFAIMCEIHRLHRPCVRQAFALVKVKCPICQMVCDFYMCVQCMDDTVQSRNMHRACKDYVFYVSHVEVK